MSKQYNIENREQLRNAILEAKGCKRTSKEFSNLCGITESTFCRLVKMKSKRTSLENLKRIAENAEDQTKRQDLFNEMKEACGYVWEGICENGEDFECIIVEDEIEILKVYYNSTISSLVKTIGNLQIKIIDDIAKNPAIKYLLIYTNSNEKKQLLEKYLRIPEVKLIIINVM